MTKNGKRLTAMLCAGMLAAAALPAVGAAALDPEPAAPDWVPTTFEDTVDFLNTHGKTYVADGYFCFIMQNAAASDYECAWHEVFAPQNPDAANEKSTVVFDQKIQFVAPEDPGEFRSDMTKEEAEQYQQQKRRYDQYQQTVQFVGEEAYRTLPTYEVVTLFPPMVQGVSTIVVTGVPKENTEPESTPSDEIMLVAQYEFTADAAGVRETDDLRWKPDCVAEFDAFRKANGTISLQEDGSVIAVAATVNRSTGAELVVDYNGKKCNLFSSGSIPVYRVSPEMIAGETTRVLRLYRPLEQGVDYFTVYSGIPWAPADAQNVEISAFAVSKDKNGTLTCELIPALKGDRKSTRLNSSHL